MTGIAKTMADLTEAVRSLTVALRGPDHEPEKGLLVRVKQLDDRRRYVDGIIKAVLTAAVIALCGWVMHLYRLRGP